MSIILDALKKLDREKLSRRGGMANIAVEILRPDPHRPVKGNSLYFAVISLTAVATVAITYIAMVKFDFISKSSPPPRATSYTKRTGCLCSRGVRLPVKILASRACESSSLKSADSTYSPFH